ncbi:MAG: glutamine--fructose-6-phosphate transaminase (isomerizing) [Candidatus Paceibacterota bacterium]|jgi:glucosamine--fructose-6-phosphate aminotransferase (isomerizing)
MCGIVAIITSRKRNLVPEIVSSLKNLEYRGYDSSGIAILDQGKIKRVRRVGAPSDVFPPDEITNELAVSDLGFSLALGHNRWATHGKPSLGNAHPHFDCAGEIAVVHNGTILNHETLKQELVKLGHTFTSTTDTEVVPHMIEQKMKEGLSLKDAFLDTAALLEGSFGLAVISTKEPGKLFIVKRGSPLLFGILKNTIIAASSSNAILSYTNTFIPLTDCEYAEFAIEGDEVTYRIGTTFNKNQTINKPVETITDHSLADISKGGYDSFMKKEIHAQPSVFRTTILGRYDEKTGDAVLGGLIDHEDTLRSAKAILTVACGTAHNASLVGGALIETLAGIPVRSEIASEFRYKKVPLDPKDTIILATSQSGETADTLESIKEAKRKGYKTFGIVNVVGSAIAEEVDAGVYARAGVEVGVASTKAFTAQLAIFYLLAIKFARERGMTAQEGRALIAELEQIPELMMKTLADTEKRVIALTERYTAKNIRVINFLGRGINVHVATEAALKFKELTYLEAGSYPLGELKHGPIAVIDENSVSVILMPHDELFAQNKNSLEQILSKNGNVIVITDELGAQNLKEQNVDIITIPTLKHSLMYPLLEILPLQLFAYHYAVALGNNVDKPRNLAKSVTVE